MIPILSKAVRGNWFRRRRRDMLDLIGLELRDLASNFLATGGVGSGKTSLSNLLLRDTLVRGGEWVGANVACVKPDAASDALKVIRSAGVEDRLLHLKPGDDFRFNFASYEVFDAPGGSPRTLTTKLDNASRLITNAKGSEQDYWTNVFGKTTQSGITIAAYAKRREFTIEDVQRVLTSTPASFDQAGSEAFLANSFCIELIKQAIDRIETADEKRQLDAAVTYLMNDLIAAGDRVRGAALGQCNAVLSHFLEEPLYSVVNCKKSSFSPSQPSEGYIAVMDAPVMVLGAGGILLQKIISDQVIAHSLARLNPEVLTLIFRDELQMLVSSNEATSEAQRLSVSRSTKTGFISMVQSLPTLQEALGGPSASQALQSLLANYSTKAVMSSPCRDTCEYFSRLWGDHIEEFVSVTESKSEELDLLNLLTGNDQLTFSVNQQMRPRVNVSDFSTLRRGSPSNNWLIDFYLTQAGKTYGPDGAPFKRLTFKQELL